MGQETFLGVKRRQVCLSVRGLDLEKSEDLGQERHRGGADGVRWSLCRPKHGRDGNRRWHSAEM